MTDDVTPIQHAYNAAGLSPLEFMIAVMNSQHLPMTIRMDAAKAAAPYVRNHPEAITRIVRLTGGIPYETCWADVCADVEDCRNRTTPCPWQRSGMVPHNCADLLRAKAQGHG